MKSLVLESARLEEQNFWIEKHILGIQLQLQLPLTVYDIAGWQACKSFIVVTRWTWPV
jgi:hypothetical protein